MYFQIFRHYQQEFESASIATAVVAARGVDVDENSVLRRSQPSGATGSG